MSLVDGTYAPTGTFVVMKYALAFLILNVSNGYFIAWTPKCANDVIGGGTPVPDPGALLLFGAGIFELGVYRNIRK